jgi:hypothetical protein
MTRSVKDGIPTRERESERSRSAATSGRSGDTELKMTRSVEEGIPTREHGNEWAREAGAWERVAGQATRN